MSENYKQAKTKKDKVVIPEQLDPIEKETGQIARLNNLGYQPGEPSQPNRTRIRAAIAEFQKDMQLPVTGECDEATREKLALVHGC